MLMRTKNKRCDITADDEYVEKYESCRLRDYSNESKMGTMYKVECREAHYLTFPIQTKTDPYHRTRTWADMSPSESSSPIGR